MMQAYPSKWLFDADTCTDLPLPKLIINTLEASMLDTLAHEIPRLIKITLNTLDTGEDGVYHFEIILVFCSSYVSTKKYAMCCLFQGLCMLA